MFGFAPLQKVHYRAIIDIWNKKIHATLAGSHRLWSYGTLEVDPNIASRAVFTAQKFVTVETGPKL